MEEKDRLQMLDMNGNVDPEAAKKLIDDAVREAQEESAHAGVHDTGKDDIPKTDTDGIKEAETDGIKEAETDGIKEAETDGIKEAESDGIKEADTDSIKEEIDAAVREAQEEAKKALEKDEKKKPEGKRGAVFRKARAKTEPLVTPRMLLGSLRYVAIILCILVVVYEGYQIIRNRIQHQEARSEYSEIADSYVVVNGSSSGVKGEGEEEDTETYPNLEIDFAKLREINSD
ncbi:MAG: hypothetical protein II868_03120, partial [Butyrivibrio sp.]|nr:hypothetical protein [Butyrivibrio sp.]